MSYNEFILQNVLKVFHRTVCEDVIDKQNIDPYSIKEKKF